MGWLHRAGRHAPRCTGTSASSATACSSRGAAQGPPTGSQGEPSGRTHRRSPVGVRAFGGDVPNGEYGGGTIADLGWHGTYELEKWTDREVKVVLHGERVQGRYVFFQTGGKNWMIHRMDQARQARLEAVARVDQPDARRRRRCASRGRGVGLRDEVGRRPRGHLRRGRASASMSRNDRTSPSGYCRTTRSWGWRRVTQCVLDGEIVAFAQGRPNFGTLSGATHAHRRCADRSGTGRRGAVVYVIFDLLHLDGRSLLGLRCDDRHELLESLELNGDSWQTTPSFSVGERCAGGQSQCRDGGRAGQTPRLIYRPHDRPGLRGRYLSNLPAGSSGNPAVWLQITVGATTYKVPAWA